MIEILKRLLKIRKRWIILGTIPFILILIFFLVILMHPIGPGLPEHMDFANAVVWNVGNLCNSPRQTNQSGQDLCISEKTSGNYPKFPSLSSMAGFVECRKTGTNESRVAAIWYFENPVECSSAEEQLSAYLKTRGTISPIPLDLTSEIQSWKYTGRKKPSPILEGTAYESNTTSGYFFVLKKAIMPGRDDCFIEYFGLIGENNLSAGSSDLRQIIAREGNPWYLFSGQTGPLS